MRIYLNRLEAGRELAEALGQYRDSDAVVLGLTRGGVAVGYAVAEELNLPLRALVVRKVGAPGEPELALGAVSETGASWLDQGLIVALGVPGDFVDAEIAAKRQEAKERQARYATASGLMTLRGKAAIVVDDGIATGASALVAIRSAGDLGASKVILAIPVAPPEAVHMLRPEVDELVVLETPRSFFAVGTFYREFEQVGDDEVIRYLQLARRHELVGSHSS